jgi:hypothetical protein
LVHVQYETSLAKYHICAVIISDRENVNIGSYFDHNCIKVRYKFWQADKETKNSQ